MAKSRTVYVCAECAAEAPRWMGRCPACGEWNTLGAHVVSGGSAGRRAAPSVETARVERLADVAPGGVERLPTGLAELDRALGGGLVPGGVSLLGGDPGIGKSTLVMQAFAGLARQGRVVLYASGEESAEQVALRGRRLEASGVGDIRLLATTALDDFEAAVDALSPDVAVVDSIQTLRSAAVASGAGTVGQLREVSARLIALAKTRSMALVLIGHVTKDGAIAGPKVLEHLVDTVLSFEGDRSHAFRVVRATKNRFGPTHEVGVFEMAQDGLREVPDPSALFLTERPRAAAGSLVVPVVEGSRALLVEVQALVAPAVYGSARRVATGLDASRLAVLLAVLDRKAGVHVLDQDVFASVAGGARVTERGVDLALALAVASSLRERPVGAGLVAFGEVGLAGEVRAVQRAEARVDEAVKLGFRRILLPALNAEQVLARGAAPGSELVGVRSLAEALEAAFD
ncbi:MAG: DNA repair protein RadA [Myxococcales bacterium]|nr:DNA repair protein RadA [Myxococcales bacterium]